MSDPTPSSAPAAPQYYAPAPGQPVQPSAPQYYAPQQPGYQQQPGYAQQPGYVPGPSMMPQAALTTGKATASMVLGICSIVLAWVFALLGWASSITALVLGIIALKRGNANGKAITGIVTGGIGLLFSIISSAIGAYMMSNMYYYY